MIGTSYGFSVLEVNFTRLYFSNADDNISVFPYGKFLNCSLLFGAVNSKFNQSIWGGDRLKIEYEYQMGVCNCKNKNGISEPCVSISASKTLFFK